MAVTKSADLNYQCGKCLGTYKDDIDLGNGVEWIRSVLILLLLMKMLTREYVKVVLYEVPGTLFMLYMCWLNVCDN